MGELDMGDRTVIYSGRTRLDTSKILSKTPDQEIIGFSPGRRTCFRHRLLRKNTGDVVLLRCEIQ